MNAAARSRYSHASRAEAAQERVLGLVVEQRRQMVGGAGQHLLPRPVTCYVDEPRHRALDRTFVLDDRAIAEIDLGRGHVEDERMPRVPRVVADAALLGT